MAFPSFRGIGGENVGEIISGAEYISKRRSLPISIRRRHFHGGGTEIIRAEFLFQRFAVGRFDNAAHGRPHKPRFILLCAKGVDHGNVVGFVAFLRRNGFELAHGKGLDGIAAFQDLQHLGAVPAHIYGRAGYDGTAVVFKAEGMDSIHGQAAKISCLRGNGGNRSLCRRGQINRVYLLILGFYAFVAAAPEIDAPSGQNRGGIAGIVGRMTFVGYRGISGDYRRNHLLIKLLILIAGCDDRNRIGSHRDEIVFQHVGIYGDGPGILVNGQSAAVNGEGNAPDRRSEGNLGDIVRPGIGAGMVFIIVEHHRILGIDENSLRRRRRLGGQPLGNRLRHIVQSIAFNDDSQDTAARREVGAVIRLFALDGHGSRRHVNIILQQSARILDIGDAVGIGNRPGVVLVESQDNILAHVDRVRRRHNGRLGIGHRRQGVGHLNIRVTGHGNSEAVISRGGGKISVIIGGHIDNQLMINHRIVLRGNVLGGGGAFQIEFDRRYLIFGDAGRKIDLKGGHGKIAVNQRGTVGSNRSRGKWRYNGLGHGGGLEPFGPEADGIVAHLRKHALVYGNQRFVVGAADRVLARL